MKKDDYGFYGKGLDGYVHYRQGMQEAARNAPNASGGRRPVSAEQKTTEPAPKSDESGQISKWILQHPLHTACMISWFIALTCVIIESLGEPSIQFMAATAVICVVALIFLGIEVINFIIWFFKTAEYQKTSRQHGFRLVFSLLLYLRETRISIPPTGLRHFSAGFRSNTAPDCPCRYARSCSARPRCRRSSGLRYAA